MIATRGNHVVICCHFFFIDFFRRGSGVAREHPSSASIPVQGQRIWDCLNLGCKDTGGKLIHSRIDNYSQCLPFLTLCNARKTETMEFVIQFIYIGNFAQTRVPFFLAQVLLRVDGLKHSPHCNSVEWRRLVIGLNELMPVGFLTGLKKPWLPKSKFLPLHYELTKLVRWSIDPILITAIRDLVILSMLESPPVTEHPFCCLLQWRSPWFPQCGAP